jgi:hypothetical protein
MFTHKAFAAVFCILIVGLSAGTANAQNWADQLFEKRSHDFGYQARNSKLEHNFAIKNKLNRRVHIQSATPSCAVCTLTKPEKDWLEPGESTVLKASIDTLKLQPGVRKDVTITVVFDQPSYATARLDLHAIARSDVVFSQNEVALGTVKRGTSATKTINIEYAGTNDWTIDGATTSNPYVETDLNETHRGNGLVGYQLKVTLKPDAPPGSIRDRITLGIKDAYNKSGVDVALQANVHADVSLSASALDIGSVTPGSTTTKQVLVRGVKPFEIVEIDGEEGPIQIEKPDAAKQLHILTVTLKAGEQPGDISQDFEIKTDMDGEAPLKLKVSAKVVAKPGPGQTAN